MDYRLDTQHNKDTNISITLYSNIVDTCTTALQYCTVPVLPATEPFLIYSLE